MTPRLRVCVEPGCPALTSGRRCPPHQRVAEAKRGNFRQRGYDAEYDRLHDQVLREEPTCRWCGAPSTTVDHIIALTLGGTNTRTNLCGACAPCQYSHGGRLAHGIDERRSRRDR